MRVRTAVLWWLVRDHRHPSLTERDMTIKSLMPLVAALFPGINYYSITGFNEVMQDYVRPALRKRYQYLMVLSADKVPADAVTEVGAVMPSQGYEWQDSDAWKARFQRFLTSS